MLRAGWLTKDSFAAFAKFWLRATETIYFSY